MVSGHFVSEAALSHVFPANTRVYANQEMRQAEAGTLGVSNSHVQEVQSRGTRGHS